jgi:predicted tellurium resistance membrane protein TerC
MKTFITAMALVFALAIGTSMIALTVHTDHTHIDQGSPYKAIHQKTALLY